MKICAYCTTENRDEAIFCTRCKRPLQAKPTRKDHSSRDVLLWLSVGIGLIGLSSYLFLSPSLFTPATIQTEPPAANSTPGARLAPTWTPEPVTISVCVTDTTRIRRSPSTHAETIGGLLSGTCFTILGRNAEATWVYIVSEDHQTGWVAAPLVSDAGTLSKVSVRDDSEWANSSHPTLTSAEIAHGAQAYLTQVASTTIPQSPSPSTWSLALKPPTGSGIRSPAGWRGRSATIFPPPKGTGPSATTALYQTTASP